MAYLVVFFAVAIAIVWIGSAVRGQVALSAGASERVSLGKLLNDLPGCGPTSNVDGAFGKKALIIVASSGVLGEIPYHSIKCINILDQSTYSSRFTVTRMAMVGVFALALPKQTKHAAYMLVISWEDSTNSTHNTAFEFTSIGAEANAAASMAEIKAFMALQTAYKNGTSAAHLLGKTTKALAAHLCFLNEEAKQLVIDDKIREAEGIYSTIITYSPKNSLALRNRGICRHVVGDQKAAWDDMVAAAALGDDDAKDYLNGEYKEA